MTIIFDGTQGITTPTETANNSVTTPVVKSSANLVFQINGTTEALRIDTSGNILNGVTSIGSALPGMYIQNNQATGTGYNIINTNASGSAGLFVGSAFSGGTYGNIQWNGSAVSVGPYAYNNPNVLCIIAGGSNNLQIGAGGAVKFYSGSLNTSTLDSSGRLTLPYQPSFHVRVNNSAWIQTSPIQFTNAPINVGSNFNTSTYRFTAPVAGKYFFIAQILMRAGSGEYITWFFRVNGSNRTYTELANSTVKTNTTKHLSAIFDLSVGDYVDVISSNAGGEYYGGNQETNFYGWLMG